MDRSVLTPVCFRCGPLISVMDLLAGWQNASVILAKRNVFVIPCCRCFANASTRSSLATRTPTTRIGYVTIRFFRFLPINRWVNLSDHNQLSAAGRTRPAPRDLLKLQDALLDWFVKICGKQVRKRGEILLDVDSTDDPTHGQQQLSFFNGGYDQHMYHPLLIFERHTGCLLAARLRPGRVVSHARIIPLLLRIVPRLQREFPKVRIKLRADAGFATPLLYEFCEFFGLQYAIGIGTNSRLQGKAQRLQRRLARRYRRTGEPQRSFSSFLYRAHPWSHQRRICYKAEHTACRYQPAFSGHQLARPQPFRFFLL